jgi:hypothetical protein
MAIYACKGCVAPKRYPGCHAVCPEYLAQKEQHDKEKAEAFKKKHIYDGLNAQAVSSIYRSQKIAKRLKGKKT